MQDQQELIEANELYKSGHDLRALEVLNTVREKYSKDYKYFILRGLIEASQNEHHDSVKSFVEAIKLEPLDPMAYANIGDALAKNLQFDEAKKYFELALQLEPDFMEAICGLGVTAFQQCDYAACETYFKKALSLKPNHQTVLTNLGNCYSVQGKYKEALKILDKVISIDPKNSLARTNRALIRLGQGKFDKGWSDYEYRWDSGNFLAKRFQDIPEWPGPTAQKHNVLIWSEQGLGDEVMFSSIFRDLEALEEEFYIECDKRLFEIFRTSFPSLKFIPKGMVKNTSPISYQLPLASLGKIFRRDDRSFQSTCDGYLRAGVPEDRIHAIKSELANLPRPWIGVSWESYALTKNFRARKSISAGEFSLVTQSLEATFVNLQFPNPHKHELKKGYEQELPDGIYSIQGLDLRLDIQGIAALLGCLDGVITIGNTVAHLCGALGVKATVLLPSVPDWRWGHEGTSSYWYKSLRFIRNTSPHSWQRVLEAALEQSKAELIDTAKFAHLR